MPFAATRTIWQIFSKYRWHVIALVVLGFVGSILEGIGINAVIPLFSFFSGGASGAPDFITGSIQALFNFFSVPFSFRYLLGFILILFLLRAISMAVFGYIRGWITADFLSGESEEMLGHTLRASWPFLLKQKIGSMHNTLVRDIQQTGALLGTLGQVIQSVSGLLMYLLVAFNISSTMTLFAILGGVVLILGVRPFLVRTQRTAEDLAKTEKQFAQFLTEHIIGMKVIKAAGVENQAIKAGNSLVRFLRSLFIRLTLIRSVSTSLFQPFSIFFVVVLFALTYKTPGFSIISFAATLYLIQKIFTYLESAQSALHSVREFVPYARNIATFKELLQKHRERIIEGGEPFALKKSIDFKGVSLSYEGREEVLSSVTFSIPQGETIGLIGPSGSGKTSIADLLLRLFEPTEGHILIDGINVRSIMLEDWRKEVGYVPQDVFLLNGSIEDNIRFYRSGLSGEEIIAAAKQANIHEFVESLSEGYDTQVGDRGVMLSGGQRQRIALARALVGAPSLLILDEATSALDSESEKSIQEVIATLHGHLTVFIIAHRLSTIEEADQIIVLEGGKVIEQGSPEKLLSNPHSYFTRGVTAQSKVEL